MTPRTLLRELIAIPSVNPMGQTVAKSLAGESRLSDFLMRFLKGRNIECVRLPVLPGRDNVIARVRGRADLPTVLWDAHQDTVPFDDPTALDPEERDGRIYGRGACDVKGGLAAMLTALDRLAQSETNNHGTVILTCTCDEELDQHGAASICRALQDEGLAEAALLRPAPEMVVVAEPTELQVGTAHCGVVRWKIRTAGKAAHSARPERGDNAIYKMARLVAAIEAYAQALPEDARLAMPLSPALSVGVIAGGESVNIVPAECAIEIDRRTVPGEQAAGVMDDLHDHLRVHTGLAFEVSGPTTDCPPLAECGDALADRLLAAQPIRPVARTKVALPFTTQAPRFAQLGLPTVVFGPGSIEQAHTAREWISIEQLEQAAETLFRFATSFSPVGRDAFG